jgi:hypothetical protein
MHFLGRPVLSICGTKRPLIIGIDAPHQTEFGRSLARPNESWMYNSCTFSLNHPTCVWLLVIARAISLTPPTEPDKTFKAVTRITYTKDEPADYWAKRGYSRYDGI